MLTEANLYTMVGSTSGSGGRGPSPSIWGRGDPTSTPAGQEGGVHIYDDFLSFQNVIAVAANVGYYHSQYGYRTYEDTGGAVGAIAGGTTATTGRGVVQLNCDTANEECIMILGDGTADLGVISGVAADQRKTMFEARVRRDTIVAADAGMFVSLSE